MLVALAVCGLLVGSVQAAVIPSTVSSVSYDYDQMLKVTTNATTLTFWSDAGVWVKDRPITWSSPSVSPSALGPADFVVNDQYKPAVEITRHPLWLYPLPANGNANWISTSAFGSTPDVDTNSGLYAIMLYDNQGNETIQGALVDLYFTADNFLGGNGASALYFNGEAVTAANNGLWGNFETAALQLFKNQYDLHFSVDLTPGQNWLYLDATSFFGPAGVIFAGEVNFATVTSERIPEPVSMSLLAAGAVGLLIRRKR